MQLRQQQQLDKSLTQLSGSLTRLGVTLKHFSPPLLSEEEEAWECAEAN